MTWLRFAVITAPLALLTLYCLLLPHGGYRKDRP